MGLYDDDLEGPRSSDSYREARSRVEALSRAATAGLPPAQTLALLRDAIQGIEAVEDLYPWIPDVDTDFVGLRQSCVGIARELRTLAVAGELKFLFEGLLSEHGRFARLLDERPGTTVELQEGSFLAPPGFRIERDEDARRVFVRPELHSRECFNAMEKVLPAAMSPELFAAIALERLREERPGLSLSERRLRRLDVADAFELAFTFPDRDGVLRGRQIVTVRGNVGITLTYLAPVATFERYAPAIDDMVTSFRFAGGSAR